MRCIRVRALLLLASAALVACTQRSDARDPADATLTPVVRSQIQSAVRNYVDVYNRADASAIMGLYARSPSLTVATDGEITRGWESLRADIDSTVVGHAGSFRLDLGSTDITALGRDHAMVLAPYTLVLATTRGQVNERGALTLILQRADSGWIVIHEHESSTHPVTP